MAVDELFSRRLPITLKCTDREDRKTNIQIAVELHTNTAPVHRKELVVRLTDESDLFFLYTLRLNEEDFQSLKVQQGLLVDFGAFPQKFIDLLNLVLQDEHKESPKFIMDLVSNGSSVMGNSTASLNIIETNPFKHLVHLSLKFLPGTDTDIKKYLAGCLKTLKEQNQTVLGKLQHTESDLSQQLRQAREALSARTLELDNLRAEWNTKLGDMSNKHAQQLATEKEKTLQTQTSSQQRYEREKRELEQAHMKIVKQMEARVYELESTNKDLTDRKYKSESTIRELKSKLSTLEDEHHRAKQELQTLRKDNSGLDADYHEQEKLINQLKTRLAVTEQEIKDKEQVLAKSSDLVETEQQQKRKYEEELERKQRQIVKLEGSVKAITGELVKGNEIIKKLQGEIKGYHTKLKLRTQVTAEQEKLLKEKMLDMEQTRKELENVKTLLRQREDENKKLNESLESTMQKLEESRQLLKTNENVINWLNKQVTEAQMGQHRHGTFEMNSTGSSGPSYKPGVGLHNYSNPSTYSTATRSSPPSSTASGVTYSARQPHVQYNPTQPKRSSVPVPVAKSSPIATIREEMSPQASPAHLSKPKLQTGDPFLDAKYFQRGEDLPARSAPQAKSPTPIHFTSVPATSTTSTLSSNPVRLSRDAIVPSHTATRGAQQVPLASAYFPNNGKVT